MYTYTFFYVDLEWAFVLSWSKLTFHVSVKEIIHRLRLFIFSQLKEAGYDLMRTSFPENEIEELSKAMQAEVSSFFEDQDEDEDTKEKPVRQYKCPYCGEVFEK